MDVESPISEVGDGAVVKVILPYDATGSVTVSVGGNNYSVVVKEGVADLVIPDLACGNYTASVVYSGDDKYDAISGSTVVSVIKVHDIDWDIEAPPVEYGGDVDIKVNLPDDATGIVVVDMNGDSYVAHVEDGFAIISVSDLEEGNYSAKVTYYGDDKYDSVSTEVCIEVINGLRITVPDVFKYYHGSERFVVYTTDYVGNPIGNIAVNITINGVTYTRTTDNDGKTSLPLNLPSRNYTGNVEFAGNEKYEAQNVIADVVISPTIFGKDIVKVFRNDTQYCALFVDSEGNPLVNALVSFNINGIFYNRTTDESGWASLNINLPEGQYVLTAINHVTGEMISNNVIVISLIESGDLIKYYRNDSQFVVRIHSADGGYVGAGEEVTFNINGVFYTRTTNETGHVKLDINLGSGEYIITTYYNGCAKSNTIKVLSRLITSDLTMNYGDDSPFVVKTLDNQGNLAPNQALSFNIMGILYNRTTNDLGEAIINIRLKPGEYIMTSVYLDVGESKSNFVIIRD